MATDASAFKLSRAVPADKSTVENLSSITTYWDTAGFEDDGVTNTSLQLNVKDAAGNTVSTATGSWGNAYDDIIFKLSTTLRESGTYTVELPEGLVVQYSDPNNKSEAVTLTYTIEAPKVLNEYDVTFSPDNKGNKGNGRIYDRDFTFVNILMPETSSYEVDFSKISFQADGQDIECTKAASDKGASFSGISLTGNHTVTLKVDKGAIFDKAYKDSKGEYGNVNNAAEYTYTIVSISGPDDNGQPLVINKLTVNGVNLLASGASISEWPLRTSLEIETSKDQINGVDAAGLLIMNITDNNPKDPDQANVAAMRNIRKNAEGKFVYELPGRDLIFYEGHTYTFSFEAVDTDDVAPDLRKKYGTAEVTVAGSHEAYKFSPVKLVKIVPEMDAEITDPGQVIELLFDGPIATLTAEQNEGNGATSPADDVYSNSAKDHWYVKMDDYFLKKQDGPFQVIIAAKDKNGLVFEGNSGLNETSCLQLNYEALFGADELVLRTLPDESTGGEVESLYKFRGDGNYAYQLVPLQTPTGYNATVIDNDRVTQYFDIDGVIKSSAEWQQEGKEIWDMAPVYCDIQLKREITAPGKYILNVPRAAFIFGQQFDSSAAAAGRFEFVINGTPAITGQSINNGDKVGSLTLVSLYSDSYASVNEGTRMNIRKDGSNYVSAPINIVYNDEGSFIFADFSTAKDTEGNPFVIEDGVEYEIRINDGALFLPETDMTYGRISIKFTGSAAAAAPVKLTQNIAGHSMTVTSVAAGATSEIALTPAQSWKVGSVKFNDEDVTENVKDNIYTTPALTADSKLDVTFEYDGVLNVTTGVDDVVTDFRLTVYSENGIIRIAGLEAGMNVKLYTVNGAFVKDADATDSTLNFEVDGGTYVLLFTKDGKTEAVKVHNK